MGPVVSSPYKEKYSIEGQYGKMRFGVSTMQGWRVLNEDSYIAEFNIYEGISIFGVFDGFGGKEVPVYLERHFIEELLKSEAFLNGDYGDALVETFQKIDDLIKTDEGKKELTLIRVDGDETKANQDTSIFAGSTGCVTLIVNNDLYVANLGETGCAILSDGEVISMSQEHRPDFDYEKRRIEKAQGFVMDGRVNGNLNVSRAIGALEYKMNTNLPAAKQLVIAVPGICKRTLKEKDELLVIGSDGIWDCATQEQILEYLREQIQIHNSPSKATEGLMDKILSLEHSESIGHDNMTCIVVTLR